MVPDSDTPNSETYDLVYRATRDALWDVLGTATLIIFHLALVAIGISAAVGGIAPFVRGSAGNGAAILGVMGLAVALFAGVRVYRLVTE